MLDKVPQDLKTTLLGKEISPVLSARDLGVVMDSTLTFDEHVTQTASKCIASLCQINRAKHVFDRKTLITIIKALVFSRLFYCSSVWGGTSKKNLTKLQNVLNFAARIVTSTRKFDHIQPVLKELEWLTVEATIKLRDAVMMFKCMNNLAPNYLCDKFIARSNVHSRNTRNKNKLNIPLCKTATGQRSFLYRATALWNSMPENIKKSEISSFKHLYRQFLLLDCYK